MCNKSINLHVISPPYVATTPHPNSKVRIITTISYVSLIIIIYMKSLAYTNAL